MNLYYSELMQIIEDKTRIKKCVYKVMRQAKLMSKFPRNITMEVNGIPERKSENLFTIIMRMSRVISYELSKTDIAVARRFCRKKPRPILLKVRNKKVRNRLLEAFNLYNVLNKEKLNSSHLRIQEYTSPILLSIHPSPLNKTHRIEARQVARANGVKSSRRLKPKTKPCAALKPSKTKKKTIKKVKPLAALTLAMINKHIKMTFKKNKAKKRNLKIRK